MVFIFAIISLFNLFSNTKEEPDPIVLQQDHGIVYSFASINNDHHSNDFPYELKIKDLFKNNVTDEYRTSKKKRIPLLLKCFLKSNWFKTTLLISTENLLPQNHRLNLFLSYQFSFALFEAFLL